MNHKNIMSTKGSILFMVLITISLVSLLGITVLSLSMMNFKMKTIDSRVKAAFYVGEAGVEEVYGVILKELQHAIAHGHMEVENQALSDSENNGCFQDAYKDYISGNLVQSIHNHDYSVLDIALDTNAPKVKVLELKDFSYSPEQFVLVIEVTHTHENIDKYFKVEYTLCVPQYSMALLDKDSILSLISCKYIEMY